MAFIYCRHFIRWNLIMEKQASLFIFSANTQWKIKVNGSMRKPTNGSRRDKQAAHPNSASVFNHATNPSDVRKNSTLLKRINIQSCGCSHGRRYLSSVCANTSTDAGKHALILWLCSLLRNPHYVSCTQSELVAHYRLQRMNQASLRQNTICAVQSKSWISIKIHNKFLQYVIEKWLKVAEWHSFVSYLYHSKG